MQIPTGASIEHPHCSGQPQQPDQDDSVASPRSKWSLLSEVTLKFQAAFLLGRRPLAIVEVSGVLRACVYGIIRW